MVMVRSQCWTVKIEPCQPVITAFVTLVRPVRHLPQILDTGDVVARSQTTHASPVQVDGAADTGS
jgi:hypothetical protein